VPRYLIRVHGRLSQELTSAFPSLCSSTEPAQTVITGRTDDSAQLSGVLNLLDDLGVDIVEIVHLR
jgi:hypothetical protein